MTWDRVSPENENTCEAANSVIQVNIRNIRYCHEFKNSALHVLVNLLCSFSATFLFVNVGRS